MIKIVKPSFRESKGFSLLELMISLSVGLVIFAGVMSVFVGMRTTTAETSNYGELQENGRFAISVLTDDLLRQNFWGDIVGDFSHSNLSAAPTPIGNDCDGEGTNNATFPIATGHFRTIWGALIEASTDDPLNCFPDNSVQMINSDVIQLKRVLALDLAPADLEADKHYLRANLTTGTVFKGTVVPFVENARTWEYQHHVYYVSNTSIGSGSNKVPVLMQGRLENSKMAFSPIIDGIEMIKFMYGVDTDTDPDSPEYGIVNAYIAPEDMTPALWDNSGGTRILAVKIFVLARSAVPDPKYINENTYLLGDLEYTPSSDGDDNYRRLLFSTTVTLFNNSVGSW